MRAPAENAEYEVWDDPYQRYALYPESGLHLLCAPSDES
jgi:hypothetical protein